MKEKKRLRDMFVDYSGQEYEYACLECLEKIKVMFPNVEYTETWLEEVWCMAKDCPSDTANAKFDVKINLKPLSILPGTTGINE